MADRLDQPAGAAKAPQRILIVDDEDIVVRSTVRILEGAGHLLTTARDATEALRELAQAPFDLAILDIMMPGIDGIEPVSYTHLDVYKRQLLHNAANWGDEVAMREKEFGIWNSFSWSMVRDRTRLIALGLKSLGCLLYTSRCV